MTSPTPSEPRTGQQLYHAPPFAPATAAKLAALAIGTIYGVQVIVVLAQGPVLVASVAGNVAVVVLITAIARKRGWTLADLGLRIPPARFIAAGVLVGLLMWYLTLTLVELLSPPGDTKSLQKIVEQTSLLPTVVALAIFPAIAEELVFRGILARGLAVRFKPLGAIALSALVFGVYHLQPAQMVSTAVLGLALAFLTLRADSIVPALVVHGINNTSALVLSRGELPRLNAWIDANPPIMMWASLVLVACGLGLAAKGVS